MDAKSKSVVILGGGLAGLACGYELAKAGVKVTIVEKNPRVGGLAITIEKDGFRFDSGPHRWYTKNDEIQEWLETLLKDELIWVKRLTRIYFDKKFFYYPMRFINLIRMGFIQSISALSSYAWNKVARIFSTKAPVTMEDGYIDQFGKKLYEIFFKRYSEKLWGVECDKLSADWVAQRTRGLNLGTVIRKFFSKKKRKVVSLVDTFIYPQMGVGRIAERMAEEITKQGGEILLNTEVKRVFRNGEAISSVEVTASTLYADEFVSSIPITELIQDLEPQPPEDILSASRILGYRNEIQVALFVKKEKVFPDNWIYVHPKEIGFLRLMEMDNWSDKLSPKGATSIMFEIACSDGDEIWRKADAELVEWVKNDFINEFKVVSESDIIGSYVHRVPKEYPVYTLGYKMPLEAMKNYLKQFENLQIIGRNGTFRYNNMDHSIEMGIYAARNILGGSFDIDSVNIEREYLEEKIATK